MAVTDVKITDLSPVTTVNPSDLFLVAHPVYDSAGALSEDQPYTSNSVNGATLSASLYGPIKDRLCKDSLTITGKANFHTSKTNLPTEDFRYAVEYFLSALEDNSHLNSIVADGSGWYHDRPTSIIQQQYYNNTGQSILTQNNSIANIDFVQRAVAVAYQSLQKKLVSLMSQMTNAHFIPSRIGEIVHSTRLGKSTSTSGWSSGETISESASGRGDALLRKTYGYGQVINGVQYPNTQWIMHSGYFLRGASSGVSNGESNAKSDDGADANTITINIGTKNLPAHSHSLSAVSFTSTGNFVTGVTYSLDNAEVNPSESGRAVKSISVSKGGVTVKGNSESKTGKTGSGTAITKEVKTIPAYKKVYIWERIA